MDLIAIILGFFLLVAIGGWLVMRTRAESLQTQLRAAKDAAHREKISLQAQMKAAQVAADNEIGSIRSELARAAPYLDVANAAAEAALIRTEANVEADNLRMTATAEADVVRRDSRDQAKERIEKAQAKLDHAGDQAQQIISEAQRRAEEIAGDAYKALRDADHLTGVANAMRNKIEGYGDRYLEPTYSLLDELADAYSFDDAGKQLKLARERSQIMVDQGRAASCNYVEEYRRRTAIAFVVDAFTGKVDSILSRTKGDNIGTLKQQISDAFALVNHNGKAFRDARITEEYLAARLEELKWAVAVIALRDKEREEQRQIKARIREEERAQREFERAKREAEKEEAAVRKAMDRMQGLLAKASEEQRHAYEQQLADLTERLHEAEAKGLRALSMAQQTRTGHVYVISNIGSFGENVYKIGMTRRLEPLDRVRELGDASVPFGFDVHAMIYAEDAPKLERELHRRFLMKQINKINPRKEFFSVGITELREAVSALGLECSWTLTANAAEYRESLAIEDRIKADPSAREHWVHHQELLDPVTDEAIEEELAEV